WPRASEVEPRVKVSREGLGGAIKAETFSRSPGERPVEPRDQAIVTDGEARAPGEGDGMKPLLAQRRPGSAVVKGIVRASWPDCEKGRNHRSGHVANSGTVAAGLAALGPFPGAASIARDGDIASH